MKKQQLDKLIASINNKKLREHTVKIVNGHLIKEHDEIPILAEGYVVIDLFMLMIGSEYYYYLNKNKCDHDLTVLYKLFGEQITKPTKPQINLRKMVISLS